MHTFVGLCVLLAFISSTWAQFQFFEQMFGQPVHQQQRPSGPPGGGQWMAHSDNVACSQYLCPDTLVCVSSPADCPCPDAQDVRCLIPDAEDHHAATVVCTRGAIDCANVERFASKLK